MGSGWLRAEDVLTLITDERGNPLKAIIR